MYLELECCTWCHSLCFRLFMAFCLLVCLIIHKGVGKSGYMWCVKYYRDSLLNSAQIHMLYALLTSLLASLFFLDMQYAKPDSIYLTWSNVLFSWHKKRTLLKVKAKLSRWSTRKSFSFCNSLLVEKCFFLQQRKPAESDLVPKFKTSRKNIYSVWEKHKNVGP